MKRILLSSIYFLGLFLTIDARSQAIYWREGFTTWTGPTSDAGVGSTVGTATGEAGVWGYYGVYRTTGTSCPYPDATANPHIRSTNTALTGNGATTDTAYLITPEVENGISSVSLIRSRTGRRVSFYWTPDASITTTNWIFATGSVKSNFSPTSTPCADTMIMINQPTARRLQIRFEKLGNSDVDSFILYSSPLMPVKFTGLSALENSGKVKVTWDIATELNTSHYLVERSSDGVSFNSAVSLQATQSKGYSWIDNSPGNGTNFYRIKGVDRDGAFMYSGVVRINLGKKNMEFTISPNPVRGKLVNLQVANIEKGSYKINVFNTIGQQVYSKSINHSGGSASYQVELPSSAKAGIYSVQLQNGETVLNKRLIVE